LIRIEIVVNNKIVFSIEHKLYVLGFKKDEYPNE